MEEELTKSIMEQLICPVCGGYMCPPIRQCKNGHSVCEQCFLRVRKCPSCRAAKSEARCFTLEAIAAKLKFPCRYNVVGCIFISLGTELTSHEVNCKHSPKYCPFRTYDNCDWQGYTNKLKAHCLKKHKNNYYTKERQKFMCQNFRDIHTYHYIYVMIYAYNEHFRVTWEIEEDTGLTKWAIYFMGSTEDAKKFSYKIEFPKEPDSNFDDISTNLTWKSPCDVLPDDDSIKFVGHKYLIVHKELLNTYCTTSGDLNYRINIYRSNYCQDDDEKDEEKELGTVYSAVDKLTVVDVD